MKLRNYELRGDEIWRKAHESEKGYQLKPKLMKQHMVEGRLYVNIKGNKERVDYVRNLLQGL